MDDLNKAFNHLFGFKVPNGKLFSIWEKNER